jgi:hypothetical protein
MLCDLLLRLSSNHFCNRQSAYELSYLRDVPPPGISNDAAMYGYDTRRHEQDHTCADISATILRERIVITDDAPVRRALSRGWHRPAIN